MHATCALISLVSIPFKRESGYKVNLRIRQRCRYDSFNSLQTGKRIQRNPFGKSLSPFNLVSIPFKRENRYKVNRNTDTARISGSIVSIPFKRENRYKVKELGKDAVTRMVSIPFKRESIYKVTLFCTQSGRGSGHLKPNANCAGQFLSKILPLKSHKPTCALTQTRFFSKRGSEARHHLGYWAIYVADARDRKIAFRCAHLKYTRNLQKMSSFSRKLSVPGSFRVFRRMYWKVASERVSLQREVGIRISLLREN